MQASLASTQRWNGSRKNSVTCVRARKIYHSCQKPAVGSESIRVKFRRLRSGAAEQRADLLFLWSAAGRPSTQLNVVLTHGCPTTLHGAARPVSAGSVDFSALNPGDVGALDREMARLQKEMAKLQNSGGGRGPKVGLKLKLHDPAGSRHSQHTLAARFVMPGCRASAHPEPHPGNGW